MVIEAPDPWKFAMYLANRCNMPRKFAHRVARYPGAKWYMARYGDGMVRAFGHPGERAFWNHANARYVGFERERWTIRWKKLP